MSWWGKLAGGAFGFMLGGPLGALLGAALGHNFDKGLERFGGVDLLDQGERERVQTAFFTATFSVLGYLAKVDGRVSRAEISFAEQVMRQLSMDVEQRKAAIALFSEGKQANFPLEGVLEQFRRECQGRATLLQLFLEIQISAVWADGEFSDAERYALETIRQHLRVPKVVFDAIRRRIEAVHGPASGVGGGRRSADHGQTLDTAYAILGVDAATSDVEVKKAYRRLLSQHHPDKLVAKGLPEEMMQLAARKTHEIKQAYETIKACRAES